VLSYNSDLVGKETVVWQFRKVRPSRCRHTIWKRLTCKSIRAPPNQNSAARWDLLNFCLTICCAKLRGVPINTVGRASVCFTRGYSRRRRFFGLCETIFTIRTGAPILARPAFTSDLREATGGSGRGHWRVRAANEAARAKDMPIRAYSPAQGVRTGPNHRGAAVPISCCPGIYRQGRGQTSQSDPRTTLFDCLRETVYSSGTEQKEGCYHRQCGRMYRWASEWRSLRCVIMP